MTDTAAVPSTVAVTINGVEIAAAPGELLIAAAERHGVYIPRFCYHPRMEPVGMCRQCLVEVDTGRGMSLQPSCMITVSDAMVVDTESEKTKRAQEGMLELLLVNHPLDCPVCDKGGECPLQDQTLAFGPGESRMVEEKRHYEKPIPISDIVYLDRERCILCDRCTRFAKDVAGDPLIHFTERGNQTQVLTFPDDPFNSYFSGNTVQICPVGALTAKPYRFRARPWDLEEVESTCTTCSVGCRVAVQSSRNVLLRYQGVDIDPVNHGWLCDKGRFDFEAMNNEARLAGPLLRNPDDADELVGTDWNTALAAAAAALTDRTVGIIGGARLTNEDAYAWSKFARTVIGTDNIDAQLADGLDPKMVLSLPKATIDDACSADTVLVVGPDLKEELPVLFLRLRGAAEKRQTRIVEVTSAPTGLSPYAAATHIAPPGGLAGAVRSVLAADPSIAAGNLVVVVGRDNLASSSADVSRAVGALGEAAPSATYLVALRRGNIMGALDMGLTPGILPGRVGLDEGRSWFEAEWGSLPAGAGLDTADMLEAAAAGRLDTLVLLGSDPLVDVPDRDLVERGLAGVDTIIAIDNFANASVRRADIVLASSGYAENAGTTTNIEGRVSRLGQLVTPPGTARRDWMIAAELAWLLGGDLGVESVEDIAAEISRVVPSHLGWVRESVAMGLDGVLLPLPALPVATEVDAGGVDVTDAPTDSDDGPDGSDESAERTESESVDGDELAEPAAKAVAVPVALMWTAPADVEAKPVDSYVLRLVARRRLYDAATMTAMSPSLVDLAKPSALHLHPSVLDRLGVTTGDRVNVTSSRTTVVIPVEADTSVPRGVAVMGVNQPGCGAGELIDLRSEVTEIQVETR